MAKPALSMYLGWLWYAARRRGLALETATRLIRLPRPGRLEDALDVIAPTLHAR